MKIKIVIAYDGTLFSGWQIQSNGKTIQEEIEKTLHRITGRQIKVTGAGRTDAGVHAKGQVAHFNLDTLSPVLLKSINALLPKEISVVDLSEASDSFHARFSAKEKTYTYNVTTTDIQMPFDNPYYLHYTYPINFEALLEGISHLIGKHDFSAFANDAKVFKGQKNPVKTLSDITIKHQEDGFSLIFKGDGFLYKMVRNLTGVLLDIGRGKLKPFDAKKILESRNRGQASAAAPAHGLTLTSISY